MSQENINSVKPFFSLIIVISSLFVFVFCKLEIRRLGYVELKLAKQERQLRDSNRLQRIALARETRPQRLQEMVAQDDRRAASPKLNSGHIIQVAGDNLVLLQ